MLFQFGCELVLIQQFIFGFGAILERNVIMYFLPLDAFDNTNMFVLIMIELFSSYRNNLIY